MLITVPRIISTSYRRLLDSRLRSHPNATALSRKSLQIRVQWQRCTRWQDCVSSRTFTTTTNEMRPLKPDTHTIGEWITGIEKTVQGLALAKVPSNAIDCAVCCNVIDLLGSFTNAADPTAVRWLQRADVMRMRNDIWGYAWSELFDVIQSHLAADALKEESTDDAVSSNTMPCKRKAVESDCAAVFYTLAQVQASYLLGQQHTGGPSKSFTPGQPKGGEKAPHINTDPNATCPKCKIHHPGGLHTCPSYQESKQILKTKYANRKFQSKKSKGAKQQDKTPEQQLPSMD
eukprot:3940359-Rhodomonas_salina.2